MENKKCAIYIRTNKEGASLIQNQISLLENYTRNEGLELDNIYLDISDASKFNRPALIKMWEDAKAKKFDVIFVKDLTRIARDPEYIRQCLNFLESINVKLITLDATNKLATSSKKRVAIYARASEEQSNKLYSISNQIQSSKNYLKDMGLELYDVYLDEVATFDLNRTGMQRLLKDSQENKFDLVITKDFSRISRNNTFLNEFKDMMKENQIDFITLK